MCTGTVNWRAEPTIRKFRMVRQEGRRQVQREIEHYSLVVIISVGYRVKSQLWKARTRLMMSHQRLKQGNSSPFRFTTHRDSHGPMTIVPRCGAI